jgi:PPOX class probable FMN-dependent enzyme
MGEIADPELLRDLYPAPGTRAVNKVIPRLDAHCMRFIALSPFCVLSTVSPEGWPDLSPRGGAPGFVRALDERTLVLPDRPGNNRLDSLSHLAAAPAVALLFFVPGVDETLRVYGSAAILPAGAFVDEAGGRPSTTALRIGVERAFFHCAKALMRAHLWSEEARIDRATFPTLGQILKDQIGGMEQVETQEEMLLRYAQNL